MGQTVNKFWSDNAATLVTVPAIATVRTALETLLNDINQHVQKQEDPTEGITQDKDTLRDQLEDQIRRVADPTFAYAMSNNDHTLGAEVSVTVSELDRMAEERLDDVAARVHAAATANLNDLKTDWAVNQPDLDALAQLRTSFNAAKNAPREKIATKAGFTATLPSKIKQMMSLLRLQGDKVMTPFRSTNPELYAGYLAARVIVDLTAKQSVQPTPPTPPTP
jgi:hypothetical protein